MEPLLRSLLQNEKQSRALKGVGRTLGVGMQGPDPKRAPSFLAGASVQPRLAACL